MSTTPGNKLSYTKVSRYEQCPMSYKLHYIDRATPSPADNLTFGSVIHAVLEELVREHVAAGLPKRLSQRRALALYRQVWAAEHLTGAALFREGVDMIKAFVKATTALDPSSILAVEKEFSLDLGDVTVVGKIDRVDRIDDTTIEVVDYKTGYAIPDRQALDSNLQLSIYHAAAQQLWPWARHILLSLHMLRPGLKLTTRRTLEDNAAVTEYLRAMSLRIRSARDYAPALSGYCAICEQRVNCPAYAKALASPSETAASMPVDVNELARERTRVGTLARLFGERKKDLDTAMKAHLADQPDLVANGQRYFLRHAHFRTYPAKPTVMLLSDALKASSMDVVERVAKIDTGALKALLQDATNKLDQSQGLLLEADINALAEVDIRASLCSKAAVR